METLAQLLESYREQIVRQLSQAELEVTNYQVEPCSCGQHSTFIVTCSSKKGEIIHRAFINMVLGNTLSVADLQMLEQRLEALPKNIIREYNDLLRASGEIDIDELLRQAEQYGGGVLLIFTFDQGVTPWDNFWNNVHSDNNDDGSLN